MKSEKISELTTNRLSVYLRCLNTLSAAGIKTISSQELAEQFNLNSAQIRKDLGYFGEFGVRGVGYFVEDLQENITKILGLDNPHRVAIIGAGRLGTALADYHGFEKSNFRVVALFDNDASKIGQHGEVLCMTSRRLRIVKEEGSTQLSPFPLEWQRVLNQVMAAGESGAQLRSASSAPVWVKVDQLTNDFAGIIVVFPAARRRGHQCAPQQ